MPAQRPGPDRAQPARHSGALGAGRSAPLPRVDSPERPWKAARISSLHRETARCAISNSPAGLPSMSSISTSESSAERPAARISPTSIASSARVPSARDNSPAERLITVSQTGWSGAPFTRRMISSRMEASGIASRHSRPPGAGFSTSPTCDSPPCSSALVLTVCTQRRPSRRSRSAIPAFLSACSGVSR